MVHILKLRIYHLWPNYFSKLSSVSSICRTIGLSDYRTVGLSDCRTIGLSDYSYGPRQRWLQYFQMLCFLKVLSVFCLQEKMLSRLLFGQIYYKSLEWRWVFCVALYQTLLRSPLLLNQFECFVLVGDIICDSRDLFDLKPCCISYKMLFDSRCSIILLAITCSSSLQEIQVRDIGL